MWCLVMTFWTGSAGPSINSYKQRIFVLLYSALTVTSVLGYMSHVGRLFI